MTDQYRLTVLSKQHQISFPVTRLAPLMDIGRAPIDSHTSLDAIYQAAAFASTQHLIQKVLHFVCEFRESSAFLNPGFRLASAIADLAGMTPILVKNYLRKHQRRLRAITFATFIVVTNADAHAEKIRTAIPQANLN